MSEEVDDVLRAMDEGGAVLGLVNGVPAACARWKRDGRALYVGRVAVLPAYRRRGLASALMNWIEERAGQDGLDVVTLCVRMSLPGNLALYRNLGYRLVDVCPHPRGSDMIGTMIKPVGVQQRGDGDERKAPCD